VGVSSCAQDAGLQRRHRVTQPFMLIADGRFRGYKPRSIAEPKEWPQCVRNVLGSTCAKHIPTFFYSATQQESSDAKRTCINCAPKQLCGRKRVAVRC